MPNTENKNTISTGFTDLKSEFFMQPKNVNLHVRIKNFDFGT